MAACSRPSSATSGAPAGRLSSRAMAARAAARAARGSGTPSGTTARRGRRSPRGRPRRSDARTTARHDDLDAACGHEPRKPTVPAQVVLCAEHRIRVPASARAATRAALTPLACTAAAGRPATAGGAARRRSGGRGAGRWAAPRAGRTGRKTRHGRAVLQQDDAVDPCRPERAQEALEHALRAAELRVRADERDRHGRPARSFRDRHCGRTTHCPARGRTPRLAGDHPVDSESFGVAPARGGPILARSSASPSSPARASPSASGSRGATIRPVPAVTASAVPPTSVTTSEAPQASASALRAAAPPQRRQDEDIERAQMARGRPLVGQEREARFAVEPQCRRLRFERRALRTVADDRDAGLGALGQDPGRRPQQVVEALLPAQHAHGSGQRPSPRRRTSRSSTGPSAGISGAALRTTAALGGSSRWASAQLPLSLGRAHHCARSGASARSMPTATVRRRRDVADEREALGL